MMNKKIKSTFFILLLALNFSCVESKSTAQQPEKPELVVSQKTDTLKFTSGIRAIFQDSKGNYWFGSHNEGVSHYNGKSFEYFTTKEGLAHNQIRAIQEDKTGKIWFATAKGASVYNNGALTSYLTNNSQPKYQWHETSGDLWFYAGEDDGVNRFDGKRMNYLIFPKPEKENHNDSYGVTDISKDKNGSVWFATYAALFNYNDKTVNSFDAKKLKLKNNELLHIRSVLADSKGRIWIGNNGIGVLLMEDNSVINFSKQKNLIDATSTKRGDQSKPGTLEHVFAIEEDAEGNIWFGDRDTGAWKYDGKKLTNYAISDQTSKTMIWTIYKDDKNNLLFGMADGSVFKFNGKAFDKQF